MLAAVVFLAERLAPPPPRLVPSPDVPGLRAEVFAVTAPPGTTRVEFRLVNETNAPIDVSRLFVPPGSRERGGISGVRAYAEPGHLPMRMIRAGRDPRHATTVLPLWHLDLDADFQVAPTGSAAVTVEVPHFPPFSRLPLRR